MNIGTLHHQYIDRTSGTVRTETLFGDSLVRLLYGPTRERAPVLFKALTSARMSSLLGWWHYDRPRLIPCRGPALLRRLGVDPGECCRSADFYDSYRKVFERQIRYWHCRPQPADPEAVLAPADARALIGSLAETSLLLIKEKLFTIPELLGRKEPFRHRFTSGDFGVFRLTPDKYHYNHLPVSGRVIDIYEVDGGYHCCNPSATVAVASILAKNRRSVTIIDTDVPAGSGVGLVAMIEIVALMIGSLTQCYSEHRYDRPRPLSIGGFARKGSPKSLFRPGSSTVVLLFEPDRIRFSDDLRSNGRRLDAASRFSDRFGRPLVETEVTVRSLIGRRLKQPQTEITINSPIRRWRN